MALSYFLTGLQAIVPSLARFRSRGHKALQQQQGGDIRLAYYARLQRGYEGISIRGNTTQLTLSEMKRLKFNFCRPIVNMGATWFAGAPITWTINGDKDGKIAKAASAIWDRSGGESELLPTAVLAGILGDALGIALHDDAAGESRIQFVDPAMCLPVFDSHDASKLQYLAIGYDVAGEEGMDSYIEEWLPDKMVATERSSSKTYSYRAFGGEMPAVWIPNQPVKGKGFGRSDLDGVLDLVEEYDHIASKQTRIIDYYAAPSIVFKGIQKSAVERDLNTAFFLPDKDADAFFLEWKGSAPDVELMLTRVRNAICEISETPAIAFGQMDSGFAHASGISLKVLYGPLEAKTMRKRASWGPALERLMQLALRAEGHDVPLESLNLTWGESGPHNGLEQAQELAIERTQLGASREAVLGKRGYTAEEIKAMSDEEPPAGSEATTGDKPTKEAPGEPKPAPGGQETHE